MTMTMPRHTRPSNYRQYSIFRFSAPHSFNALLIPMVLSLTGYAHANPIDEANQALKEQNISEAIRVLQRAADNGDAAAKGLLSNHLRNFPPPYKDVERACKLAKEASDSGDAMGLVTRTECILTGTEKTFHPISQARHFARLAWKKGSPAGGFMLYLVYSQDPQYRYNENGKFSQSKYDALAAMPVKARTDQIEALEALSDAMNTGHINAVIMGLAYLSDSAAPDNIDRMLSLSRFLQKNGEKTPPEITSTLKVAQEINRLGNSYVSPSLFRNILNSTVPTAAIKLKQTDNTPCDLMKIKLSKMKAEPISDPEYLPISGNALKNSYLLKGSWAETWTFEGCGKSTVMQLNFTADGWSGARFTAATE